jgi:hypothetical protein
LGSGFGLEAAATVLGSAAGGSVRDVVARLGAVAAFPDSTPELAIGLRRHGSLLGHVSRAVEVGEVIKTYAFRGATHLITGEQGGAYLALRASGRQWELPSWQRSYQLAPNDWPIFRECVRGAVADGPMTVAELAAAVGRKRRFRAAAAGLDGKAVLKALMWQGDLCFGPSRDGQATVRGFHEVPHWAGLPDIDVAGRWAVEAYVRAYGPTTADGVQYYLGAGLSAGRKAVSGWIKDVASKLTAVDIDDEELLLLSDDVDDLAATDFSPSIHLLPASDPWVMGPGTANVHVVPPVHRQLVTRGANLVLADGVFAGTWARSRDTLTVAWLDQARSPDLGLLGDETERLAALSGTQLDLHLASG